jgi:hypothetical protein
MNCNVKKLVYVEYQPLIDIQIAYLISKALLRLNCAMAVLADLRLNRFHSSSLFGVRSTVEESIKCANPAHTRAEGSSSQSAKDNLVNRTACSAKKMIK